MSPAVETDKARSDASDGSLRVGQTLVSMFEQQAILHSSRLALGSGDWQPSYAELNGAANYLARRLLAHGGAASERIALLMQHDSPLIAAVLSVLKSGRIVVVKRDLTEPVICPSSGLSIILLYAYGVHAMNKCTMPAYLPCS